MVHAVIGAQAIPLPTGGPDYAIVDPLCVAIADYLAFYIRWGLGARGSEQRPAEITDALPAANVFAVDPGKTWTRDPAKLPALYVWWSERTASRWERWGLQRKRERILHIQYVLAEIVIPEGQRAYSGLTQAVDGIVDIALHEGYHPDYSYASDPPGTPLLRTLGAGKVSLAYIGGDWGYAMQRPEAGTRDTLHRRAYPVYIGKIRATEISDGYRPPAEELTTLDATINTSDGLTILEREVGTS